MWREQLMNNLCKYSIITVQSKNDILDFCTGEVVYFDNEIITLKTIHLKENIDILHHYIKLINGEYVNTVLIEDKGTSKLFTKKYKGILQKETDKFLIIDMICSKKDYTITHIEGKEVKHEQLK